MAEIFHFGRRSEIALKNKSKVPKTFMQEEEVKSGRCAVCGEWTDPNNPCCGKGVIPEDWDPDDEPPPQAA